jgi:hypothetical protein
MLTILFAAGESRLCHPVGEGNGFSLTAEQLPYVPDDPVDHVDLAHFGQAPKITAVESK